MPSNRWLKAVSNEPQKSETETPVVTPNVSMSDLRRLQQEKAQRSQVLPASDLETKEALPAANHQPTPRTPPTPPTPPTQRVVSNAPERDFSRVANSIVREAVAAGQFIGKSKQLYDYLYLRTRGAIVPTRVVRLPKPELMKGAGIGSERTLLKNISHLKSIGLITVAYTDGKHEGNEYEVFLPEEINQPAPRTPPHVPHPRHAPQKLPPVPPVESGVRDVGSSPVESTTYEPPKTFIKTYEKFDDDDAFAPMLRAFRQATTEITGRQTSAAEAKRWADLAELLIGELKIAALRTNVSSVPAFLTEHLRRRLWKKDQKQLEVEQGQQANSNLQTLTEEEKKNCPDCGGAGRYYPEGYDKGVKLCRHEKLREQSKS